ncbi:DUF3466 family protein [Photobacterium ganghwense]|uniref:DUF3466 family protein n=1 Tax=Photobacterium ganghwense TaxID=320778 RepID=UPI0040575B3C
MQHNTLKLSTLAILIAGATSANAAVYKVVEIDADPTVASRDYFPENVDQNKARNQIEYHGQGISPSADGENCFVSGGCSSDNYQVFGESRFGAEGLRMRDVVPFISDNYQEINDEDRLYRYCDRNLGPNTCDTWARSEFYGKGYNTNDIGDRSGLGGLVREQEAWTKNFYANSQALLTNGNQFSVVETFASDSANYSASAALGDLVADRETSNSVVTHVGDLSGQPYELGIASSAYFGKDGRYARQFAKRGFVNVNGSPLSLGAVSSANELTKTAGQSLAFDAVEFDGKLLVVGSASFAPSDFRDSDLKVPNNRSDRGDPTFSDSTFRECANLFSTSPDSFYSTKECQLSVFANDAVFWTVDGSSANNAEANLLSKRVAKGNPELEYRTLDPDNNDRSYQAGARAVALVSGKPVVVGFTTDSIDKTSIDEADKDYYAIRASVWELPDGSTTASSESFTRKIIPGLDIEDGGGERKLTYSIATDVNENNKVIGVAKNYLVDNRSYSERMFVYDNNNPSASPTFLDSSISSLFFKGANGYAAAINNNDQIVGRLDAESVNQVDGRFRRQRAFTYVMSDIPGSAALKKGDVYLLDDLTNDGVVKGDVANQYRIFEATGINDAGVISATAYKCEGGYDDLTKESFCQGGASNVERIVAVKLVPIDAAQSPSVESRPTQEASIERSGGGSLGVLALTVLGWLGFRRRK